MQFQCDAYDGLGEWPRHEIDFLCCDSIPACTDSKSVYTCVLHAERLGCVAGLHGRRGDLPVMRDVNAAGGSNRCLIIKGDPKVPGRP